LDTDLQQLRIDKRLKAKRDERPAWPWVVVILLLGGGAFVGWQFAGKTGAPTVEVTRVVMPAGAVADGDLVVLNATGYIMAAHKIELASKVIGRVAWVGVEMGDKVERGQELVRLEDDEYRARVAEQQGQLDAAKAKLAELEAGSRPQEIAQEEALLAAAQADLDNAQRNYERLQRVGPDRGVTAFEVDQAATLVASRKAAVDKQRHSLEMAKLGPRAEQIAAQRAVVRQIEGSLALANVEAANTVIKSPISGSVLERNVEVGEFVTNGFVGDRGAKGYVVSLADLTDLRVELDVSQNDFAKVRADQPCWITTDAYPDRKYEGVVHLISPEANRQKATVQVRVRVLNPDERLKPDMNATVAFLSPEKLAAARATTGPAAAAEKPKPTLKIPATAVRGGNVFVVENNKAVARAVVTAPAEGGQVEVRKGLIGGEDLIVNPPDGLADGQSVKTK
jgi:HlyD family secretion protein